MTLVPGEPIDRTNGRSPEPVTGARVPAPPPARAQAPAAQGHPRVALCSYARRAALPAAPTQAAMAYAGAYAHCRSTALATPNYSYEKRQRELAKKRKAEEKRQKKLQRGQDGAAPEGDADAPAPDADTAAPATPQPPQD